jgi:hypothetical protein
MTAVWGPLGWMTLHSVSALYPEAPTPSEKQLLATWLDLFRDTITCPSCRGHFTELLSTYRRKFPELLDSRQTFMVFAFRAHNAVNRRLNKPVYATVEECMATLQGAIKTRTARDYRGAYLLHITRHWSGWRDVTGITALRKIAEMNKIESTYFAPRDINLQVTLAPDVVVLPRGVLESGPGEAAPTSAPPVLPRFAPPTGFRITGGGIRLRR